MQYLLLIYENSAHWATLSKDERNRIHEDCGAWYGQMMSSGHARQAMALAPGPTAATVRQVAGAPVFTDGPFAETKEVLGGLAIVECRDLAEAKTLAETFPALRVGFAMEVRALKTDGCIEE